MSGISKEPTLNGGYSGSRGGYKSKESRHDPMKSNSGCFKCGKEGHFSRECPENGGSGKRNDGCFKCGESGHFSRECPQNGGSGKKSDGCFKCGESGHFSRECPQNGGSGRRSGGDGCFKCGESGHFSRECPQNGGSGRGGRGGRGPGRGGGRNGFGRSSNSKSDEGCFKCGEPGHFSRECPNKRQRSNGDDPSSGFGIKFGQAGAGLSAINWSEVTLLPFQKDFYKEAEATKSVDQSTLDEWKKEHDIEIYSGYHESIKGSDDNNNKWNKSWNKPKETPKAPSSPVPIPNPVLSFKDAADSFSPIIMKSIEKAGFEKPTPIQSATWPMVLAGKNVIGIARTGSGKTLAFLLPAIVHINAQPKIRFGDGPIAVIIAPTRELACQIEGEVDKFACNTRHCCVYGGAKKWDQKRKLRQGVEIVIATPGRLLDFLESEVTNFKRVTYTVIDEADRLLDMGFEPQLNAIMNQIRPDRQMMMFSATWPKEVRSLAKKYMVPDGDDSNVFQVACGSMNKLQANENVKQEIQFMDGREKIKNLKQCIDDFKEKEGKDSKILVFISTKKMCNRMQDILWEDGYWVTCMHGDKEQKQRDRALNDFKNGKMKIMLATDVASRGIHVDDIKLVVNFDFPTAIEDYVHRIGRTGRAGNKGLAISFFVEETDGYRARDLMKVLKDAKQEIPEQLKKYQKSTRGQNKYGRRQKNFYRNNFGRRW
mmetsp:Transcript_71790/g.64490  ORF Transcript_71790/g.64490 Transcript_71790/m.64490 type:complete len:710 (-) Transcript_71790:94-2223(-)